MAHIVDGVERRLVNADEFSFMDQGLLGGREVIDFLACDVGPERCAFAVLTVATPSATGHPYIEE